VTSNHEQKIIYPFYIACARGTMPSKVDGSDRQVLTSQIIRECYCKYEQHFDLLIKTCKGIPKLAPKLERDKTEDDDI
jgi:hypothetical protein